MIVWLGIIIGILAGLLLGALCTIRINLQAGEETAHQMATVFSKAVVGARNETYLRQYGLSQIECDESHLSGDCPLCGAK